MCGGPCTIGLSVKRGSHVASGTSIRSALSIALEQKDSLRGPPRASRPSRDLNHCRSRSTSDTSTIGTSNRCWASLVIRSNRSSAGVSSSFDDRTAAVRSNSASHAVLTTTRTSRIALGRDTRCPQTARDRAHAVIARQAANHTFG